MSVKANKASYVPGAPGKSAVETGNGHVSTYSLAYAGLLAAQHSFYSGRCGATTRARLLSHLCVASIEIKGLHDIGGFATRFYSHACRDTAERRHEMQQTAKGFIRFITLYK